MLFYTALMGTFGASLLLPFFWVTPSWPQVGWMAAMGALGGVSHMLMIQAYRHADIAQLGALLPRSADRFRRDSRLSGV